MLAEAFKPKLASYNHFMLIESLASIKNLQLIEPTEDGADDKGDRSPLPLGGRHEAVDSRGQRGSNMTHRSTIDSEPTLCSTTMVKKFAPSVPLSHFTGQRSARRVRSGG